jgi:hypothetical protein
MHNGAASNNDGRRSSKEKKESSSKKKAGRISSKDVHQKYTSAPPGGVSPVHQKYTSAPPFGGSTAPDTSQGSEKYHSEKSSHSDKSVRSSPFSSNSGKNVAFAKQESGARAEPDVRATNGVRAERPETEKAGSSLTAVDQESQQALMRIHRRLSDSGTITVESTPMSIVDCSPNASPTSKEAVLPSSLVRSPPGVPEDPQRRSFSDEVNEALQKQKESLQTTHLHDVHAQEGEKTDSVAFLKWEDAHAIDRMKR